MLYTPIYILAKNEALCRYEQRGYTRNNNIHGSDD